MEIDNSRQAQLPQISILMAVYEPRMDWLREQLLSLNAQTYPNLMLYVRDDHSPTVPYEEIQSCVQDCISAFPWIVRRNEENLGSNGTFELLTREAEGDLFAYCDQDDVWLPEKLTVLREAMEKSGALLACSDMSVMDERGQVLTHTGGKLRQAPLQSGADLAGGLLFRNFATGCAMLVDGRAAREAVPFCPHGVYDQHLALCCAARGAVISVKRPLVCHRVHGKNQTGSLVGVTDKADYGRIRIDGFANRMAWYSGRLALSEVQEGLIWANARRKHWRRRGGLSTMWKYRRFGKFTVCFESVAPYLPDAVFNWLVRLRQHRGKR